jgi:hypothetical protein
VTSAKKWRSARAAEPAPKPRTASEGRERGEGVEVGGCERAVWAAREGEGVDVAGAVEEEEARAGERVGGGARGDVGDANVIVRGADVRDELELIREGMGAGIPRRSGGGVTETEDRAAREWNRHRQRQRRHGEFVFSVVIIVPFFLLNQQADPAQPG